MDRDMEQPAADPSTPTSGSGVMPRRKALKRLGGGAVAGALLLTGCTPAGAPTPVATSRPSPAWTPAPSGSSDGIPSQATSIQHQQQTDPNR